MGGIDLSLDIYGGGPNEKRVRRMTGDRGESIRFYAVMPIDGIRDEMRAHDVYVFASDTNEAWGVRGNA